jgi:hypothetical protein
MQEDTTPMLTLADVERRREAARWRYQQLPLYRNLLIHLVARVMQEYGPIDPDKPERAAHDIAMDVGAIMLETLHEEEGYLAAYRAEADALRKALENHLRTCAVSHFVIRNDGQ